MRSNTGFVLVVVMVRWKKLLRCALVGEQYSKYLFTLSLSTFFLFSSAIINKKCQMGTLRDGKSDPKCRACMKQSTAPILVAASPVKPKKTKEKRETTAQTVVGDDYSTDSSKKRKCEAEEDRPSTRPSSTVFSTVEPIVPSPQSATVSVGNPQHRSLKSDDSPAAVLIQKLSLEVEQPPSNSSSFFRCAHPGCQLDSFDRCEECPAVPGSTDKPDFCEGHLDHQKHHIASSDFAVGGKSVSRCKYLDCRADAIDFCDVCDPAPGIGPPEFCLSHLSHGNHYVPREESMRCNCGADSCLEMVPKDRTAACMGTYRCSGCVNIYSKSCKIIKKIGNCCAVCRIIQKPHQLVVTYDTGKADGPFIEQTITDNLKDKTSSSESCTLESSSTQPLSSISQSLLAADEVSKLTEKVEKLSSHVQAKSGQRRVIAEKRLTEHKNELSALITIAQFAGRSPFPRAAASSVGSLTALEQYLEIDNEKSCEMFDKNTLQIRRSGSKVMILFVKHFSSISNLKNFGRNFLYDENCVLPSRPMYGYWHCWGLMRTKPPANNPQDLNIGLNSLLLVRRYVVHPHIKPKSVAIMAIVQTTCNNPIFGLLLVDVNSILLGGQYNANETNFVFVMNKNPNDNLLLQEIRCDINEETPPVLDDALDFFLTQSRIGYDFRRAVKITAPLDIAQSTTDELKKMIEHKMAGNRNDNLFQNFDSELHELYCPDRMKHAGYKLVLIPDHKNGQCQTPTFLNPDQFKIFITTGKLNIDSKSDVSNSGFEDDDDIQFFEPSNVNKIQSDPSSRSTFNNRSTRGTFTSLNSVSSSNSEVITETKILKDKVALLEKKLKEAQNTTDKQSKENVKLHKVNRELSERVNKLNEENKSKLTALTDLKKKLTEAVNNNATQNKTIAKLTADNKKLDGAFAQKRDSSLDRHEFLESLRTIESLNKRLQELTIELTRKEQEFTKLRSKHEQEVCSLKDQLKDEQEEKLDLTNFETSRKAKLRSRLEHIGGFELFSSFISGEIISNDLIAMEGTKHSQLVERFREEGFVIEDDDRKSKGKFQVLDFKPPYISSSRRIATPAPAAPSVVFLQSQQQQMEEMTPPQNLFSSLGPVFSSNGHHYTAPVPAPSAPRTTMPPPMHHYQPSWQGQFQQQYENPNSNNRTVSYSPSHPAGYHTSDSRTTSMYQLPFPSPTTQINNGNSYNYNPPQPPNPTHYHHQQYRR